jgi:ligand-binding sensor domain-containing protein
MDNGITRVETSSPLSQFTVQSGINTGVLTVIRFDGDLYVGSTNGLLKFNKNNSLLQSCAWNSPKPDIQPFVGWRELTGAGGRSVCGKKWKIDDYPLISKRRLNSWVITHSKFQPDILVAGGVFGVYVFTKKNISSGEKGSGNWNYVGKLTETTDQVWNVVENKDGEIWGGTQNGVALSLYNCLR